MNVNPSFENAVVEQDKTENDKVSEMLRAGVKAAQAGNRSEARSLLLSVTDSDAANEEAWLWLSSISEYPKELLVFLKNVLNTNPENERAVEWTKATQALLAKTFVQRGIDAHKQDRTDFAKQCFLQAILNDEENELAWLWLASMTDAVEEKMSHLQKVLRINPENGMAHASFQAAKSLKWEDMMRKANAAAVSGQHEEANIILDEILQHSPDLEDAWVLKSYLTNSFDEKLQYYEKVLEINPTNETAQASVNSLRLMKSAIEAKEAEENQQHAEEFETETVAEVREVSEIESSEAEAADFEQIEESAVREAEEFSEAQSLQSESAFEETGEEQTEEQNFSQVEEEISQSAENSFEETAYQNEPLELASENSISAFGEVSEEILESKDSEKEDFYSQNMVSESVEEVQFIENEIFEPLVTAAAESEYIQFDAPVEETAEQYQPEETAEEKVVVQPEMSDEFEDEIVEQTGFEAENAENEEIIIDESVAEDYEAAFSENGNGAFHYHESEQTACPFCRAENDVHSFTCNGCNAVLTLSDLEMILAHKNADAEMLRRAVEQMEVEEADGGFDAVGLTTLGIGCINLKNLPGGLSYLRKAARLDPNNILLNSQVNSLAIRLAEIAQQESIHRSMPQNRTIMVVDDSATVRKLICGKLEKSGHTVVSAVDGVDALEKLKDFTPDLVLLDITMPRIDGYQVCKMIRNNPAMKDIPVVMISGKDGFFDKVRGRMAGTTGYITKPFGPETLMKTVEAFVSQKAEAVQEDEMVVSS